MSVIRWVILSFSGLSFQADLCHCWLSVFLWSEETQMNCCSPINTFTICTQLGCLCLTFIISCCNSKNLTVTVALQSLRVDIFSPPSVTVAISHLLDEHRVQDYSYFNQNIVKLVRVEINHFVRKGRKVLRLMLHSSLCSCLKWSMQFFSLYSNLQIFLISHIIIWSENFQTSRMISSLALCHPSKHGTANPKYNRFTLT